MLAALLALASCGRDPAKRNIFVKDDGCIYYKGKKMFACAWRRAFVRENRTLSWESLDKCMARAPSVAATQKRSIDGVFVDEKGRRVEAPSCTEITRGAGFSYNYNSSSGVVLTNSWSGSGKNLKTVSDAYIVKFLEDGMEVRLIRSDTEVPTLEQEEDRAAAYARWKEKRRAAIRKKNAVPKAPENADAAHASIEEPASGK
jgi:hypothetical protein